MLIFITFLDGKLDVVQFLYLHKENKIASWLSYINTKMHIKMISLPFEKWRNPDFFIGWVDDSLQSFEECFFVTSIDKCSFNCVNGQDYLFNISQPIFFHRFSIEFKYKLLKSENCKVLMVRQFIFNGYKCLFMYTQNEYLNKNNKQNMQYNKCILFLHVIITSLALNHCTQLLPKWETEMNYKWSLITGIFPFMNFLDD